MGFVFIVISPLVPSHCGFFFVFGHGVSFSGELQHPPVNGCSTASCNFDVLVDENTSFYSAILNQSQEISPVSLSRKTQCDVVNNILIGI